MKKAINLNEWSYLSVKDGSFTVLESETEISEKIKNRKFETKPVFLKLNLIYVDLASAVMVSNGTVNVNIDSINYYEKRTKK